MNRKIEVMKKAIALVVLVTGTLFSVNAQENMLKEEKMMKDDPMSGEEVQMISLEQTPGEFTQKELTVPAGTYVFEIFNNAVGHDVGFVLVKKGEDLSKQENHIQSAYVTKAVGTGKTQKSQPTALEAGEYVYFCPLNPTATNNTLTVE